MDADVKHQIETLLVAQVLTLARELARESKVQRVGGDYVHEACALIRQSRSRVLQELGGLR